MQTKSIDMTQYKRKVLLIGVLSSLAATITAGCATNTQNPAYSQVAGGDYASGMASPTDMQIQAVKQNFEEVKAQAQAQIDARNRAQAAAAKKKAAAEQAAARERAKKAAKIEKRNDEKAQIELEMMRLDLQKKKAQVGADSAISDATAQRAKDLVDTKVETERAQVERIRAESEAIRAGTKDAK